MRTLPPARNLITEMVAPFVEVVSPTAGTPYAMRPGLSTAVRVGMKYSRTSSTVWPFVSVAVYSTNAFPSFVPTAL